MPPTPPPPEPTLLTPKPATLPTKGKDKPTLPPTSAPKGLPGTSSNPKHKLLIGSVFALIAVVVLVLIVTTLINRSRNGSSLSTDSRLRPTPTLIPRPTLAEQLPGEASPYATDPQILELEAAIKTLNAQLTADTLSEPEIRPPLFETKISF